MTARRVSILGSTGSVGTSTLSLFEEAQRDGACSASFSTLRPAVRATIWTSQAPQWACFDEGLPRVEGQPPPAA